MALIPCPDCNRQISESAISCPHCGLPRPLYELRARERRAEEAAAERERRAGIRRLFIAGGLAGLASIALLAWALFWPQGAGSLGRRALIVLLAGSVGFVAYRILAFAWRDHHGAK